MHCFGVVKIQYLLGSRSLNALLWGSQNSVSTTVSLVSHVPLTCKTLGVNCSSCRAATTMKLTYSCLSWSQVRPQISRLLIACRSLPVSTVIVSPLWGSIACFVVIKSRFSSLSCVKQGRRFLGKDKALEHETNAIVYHDISDTATNWKIVDCSSLSFVVATGRSPSSMWFSLSQSFREFIRFWAHTISFCFWLAIAIQYGTVELLTKSSG